MATVEFQRKIDIYEINHKIANLHVGYIQWDKYAREWVFTPYQNVRYRRYSLREIAEFMDKLEPMPDFICTRKSNEVTQ